MKKNRNVLNGDFITFYDFVQKYKEEDFPNGIEFAEYIANCADFPREEKDLIHIADFLWQKKVKNKIWNTFCDMAQYYQKAIGIDIFCSLCFR